MQNMVLMEDFVFYICIFIMALMEDFGLFTFVFTFSFVVDNSIVRNVVYRFIKLEGIVF
jgi:hypothetical protein